MSLWLSSANAATGRLRSAATAEAARQTTEAFKQAARFWAGAYSTRAKPRKRR